MTELLRLIIHIVAAWVMAQLTDDRPPFDSGNPDRASDTVKATVAPRYEQARASFHDRLARLSTAFQ
jgi:hypothetical protein